MIFYNKQNRFFEIIIVDQQDHLEFVTVVQCFTNLSRNKASCFVRFRVGKITQIVQEPLTIDFISFCLRQTFNPYNLGSITGLAQRQ